MAKRDFLVDVDLNNQQLLNFRVQNLATPPSALEGALYYDTDTDSLWWYSASPAQWNEIGAANVNSVSTGVAISNSGTAADPVLNLDYTSSLTAGSTFDVNDTIAIYDNSALAMRYLTHTQFISQLEGDLTHNNITGGGGNIHIDHSTVSITTAANSGLAGGGDITTTRTLTLDINNLTDVVGGTLQATDQIAVYDGSATSTRKLDFSDFEGQLTASNLSDGANLMFVNAAASITATHTFTTGSLVVNSGGTLQINSGATATIADAPSAGTDIANKAYVDSVAQGLDAKASVRVATTTNGALTTAFANGQTVDGITLATNDRILIKNQSTASENGIYIVQSSGSPVRANDANTWDEYVSAFVFVEVGTANADTGWVCTADQGGVLDTNNLPFVQFSSAGSYTAGDGLELIGGNQFAIDLEPTNPGLQFATGDLQLGTPGDLTGSTTSVVTGAGHTHLITTGITSGDILESSGGTNGYVAYYDGTGIASEAQLATSRGGTGLSGFTGANRLLYSTSSSALAALASANDAILVTNGTGVPSISQTIPTATKNLAGNYAGEVNRGFVELADQTEVDDGNGTDVIPTTTKLRAAVKTSTWASTGTTDTIAHGLNTTNVAVQSFYTSGGQQVELQVVHTDANNVTLTSNSSVTAGAITTIVSAY